MRTEKQIKKRILECKKQFKEIKSLLKSSKPKEKKGLNEYLNDLNYEISILEWVLTSVDDLPF